MNHKFQLLAESDLEFFASNDDPEYHEPKELAQCQDLDSQTYKVDGFGVVQSDSPKNSANSMGTQQITKKWLQHASTPNAFDQILIMSLVLWVVQRIHVFTSLKDGFPENIRI